MAKPQTDPRLFYSASQHADNALLSNFTTLAVPLMIGGRMYHTVEHFYQAAKCYYVGDDVSAITFTADHQPIVVGPEGRDAKVAANALHLELDGWDAIKDAVMEHGLAARARVDPEFRRVLLTSRKRGALLRHYERSGAASYWGGRFGADGTFVGRNRLGEMLMALRESLAQANGLPPLPEVTEPSPWLMGATSGALVTPCKLTQTVIRLLQLERWRKPRAAVSPLGDSTSMMVVPVSVDGAREIGRHLRGLTAPIPDDLAQLLAEGEIRWVPERVPLAVLAVCAGRSDTF